MAFYTMGSLSAEARFFPRQELTQQQKLDTAHLEYEVLELAKSIEKRLPEGRQKSLTLTALEEVSMRAARAVAEPL